MKAQSSLELLAVFGMLLVILTAVVNEFYINTEETIRISRRNELKALCSEISRAILAAKIAGNGYHEYVAFAPVNLSFFPDARVLAIDTDETCYLPTSQIVVESIGEDEINISNVNGSVIIA